MSDPDTGLSPRLRESGVLLMRRFLNDDARRGELDVPTATQVLEAARMVKRQAPLFRPRMFDGTPFRYRMTNCGVTGWLATPDPRECVTAVKEGYYYSEINPYNGRPWPEMPDAISRAAIAGARLAGWEGFRPEACLINLYCTARENLGIHQDRTERNLRPPVVSLSLGDTGVFQIGGATKHVPLETIYLESGDLIVLAGPSRMFFHKFERLLSGTSDALNGGGRLNLTIRQVER